MPIVQVQYRGPRPPAQLEAASSRIIDAIVDEWDLDPEQVQVFLEPYDDDHWYRGQTSTARSTVAPPQRN